MIILFYILIFLYAGKVLWNFYIPVYISFFWSDKDKEERGVSLAPIEFLILAILVAITYFDKSLSVLDLGGLSLGIVGGGLIILSYLWIYIVLKACEKSGS
ncbi:hypothetical protein [Pseudoalteromonas rubra]|uniref:Uncharacterized protein n=1 Tax=Pseudoalteromonas rubra TaxID=43658 RepID=A0A0F4QCV9_9GAMM|nr:hypothetical protein [Pseudoalteromonas rubra]KJZ05526.1 hypothetical protein TW77_22525 [Pseudoalteromonas rubra]